VSTKRPLRIFFASAADVFVAGEGNGEGIIATALVERLVARGHDVTACVGIDKFGERPRLRIHELDRPRDLQTLQPFLRARRALRAFRADGGAASFDVVHALFPNWAPGIDARAYEPLPFVLGPIMLDWHGTPRWWPLGFALRRGLNPWLLRRRRRTISAAAVLATVGPWVRPSSLQAAAAVVDVPFGVMTTEFPPSPVPSSGFVLLYVGRYDEARGVLDLARAVRSVAPEIADLKMIFVGDGPLRGELEAVARETRPAAAIEVRGRVRHEDVGQLMRECSVFCMPSWGEPFGMAVIEAMSSGRAVIAADAGALAWLITEGAGGRLVPPKDVSGLADAIRDISRDRGALARMGDFNRRQAEERYDLDLIVDRWEALYADAIDAPEAGRRR